MSSVSYYMHNNSNGYSSKNRRVRQLIESTSKMVCSTSMILAKQRWVFMSYTSLTYAHVYTYIEID